jgi:hypothetical protein
MSRRIRWGIGVALLLTFCVVAQAQESYLDEYLVHVKPDKRTAYDALIKKLVAANREHGDTWVALETAYGQSDTLRFVSIRSSYAETDQASGVFMGAVEKALGHPGTENLFENLASYTADSRNLLLRRRPDLSANYVSDPAAQARVIGETRWIRLIRIVVKIGMGPRFEELAKQAKAAEDKDPSVRSWISQSIAGERPSVYYVAELQNSMAGFDSSPGLPKLMGNDAYMNFVKGASEVVDTEEVTLNRFVPELSNPPAETVSAAPDFWRPKPAPPKAAAAKPVPNSAQPKN